MLVLSRKPGERIQIGDEISIEVRRIAGNRVTLSIDAPRNVHILRGELEPFDREYEELAPSQAHSDEEPYHVEHVRVPDPRRKTRRREAVHA